MNIPHFFLLEFLVSNLDTQNRSIFLYSIFFSSKLKPKGKNESVPKIPFYQKISNVIAVAITTSVVVQPSGRISISSPSGLSSNTLTV